MSNACPVAYIDLISTPCQEGMLISVSGHATDPGNDPLTYTWEVYREGTPVSYTSIVPGDSMIVFNPREHGIYQVVLTATDDGGAYGSSDPWYFAVDEVNNAPSFTKGSNQVVTEDPGKQTINNWATSISAGASDESGQTLTFEVTTNNDALFMDRPAVDPATGTLTYTPAANANGVATVTVKLKDNGGTALGGQDTSAGQTFTITVNPVNDAPVLSGSNNLAAIAEDAGGNTGTLVSDLVAGKITDVDSGAVQGFAITAVDTTGGSWQYTMDGGASWTAVPAVNNVAALLLPANANTRVRFVPNANWNGIVANGLTFRAWDQTSGAAGATADTTNNGRITAFSTATASSSITVNAVNDAPVLSGSNNLAAINEDVAIANNSGTLVSDLIAGKITDVDAGAVQGIAVTAVSNSNGAWQYTTDGGANWSNFGTPTTSAARLLAATASTRVRFVPNPNWNGAVSGGLTFRAWDQTSGAAGATAGTSSNGGSTAFSTATASASITVNAINDAPMLSGANNLAAINENVALASNPGTLASDLVAGKITDVDAGAAQGIAVVAVDTAYGSWQYTMDGGVSWTTLAGVTNAAALLLAADTNTRVRFTPGTDWNGTLAGGITFRAWDRTSGAAGVRADTTVNGGSTAFSAASFAASITVNGVNDAPSFTKGADQVVLEDAGAQDASNWATAISAGAANEGAQTLTFAVTTDNDLLFSVLPAIDSTGKLTYTPAANANGAATVTVKLQDNGGTAFGGVDTSASQTFTITLTPVNDAPSFSTGANQTIAEDAGAQTVVGWATGISKGAANEVNQTLSFLVATDNNAFFSTLPAVDPTTGTLTYTPASNANGVATVTVKLKDDGGTAWGGVDTSAEQSFTITITPVNDAPVLSGTADLAAIDEDAFNNAGTRVSDLIVGQITDVDSGAKQGIAITAVDSTHGTWEYSTNDGTSWTAIAGVTDATALLLASDANTRVRFVPAADWNGTITDGITFRAWDQSTGVAGAMADTSSNGGITAFSMAT
ncbi:MAG: tandem-95 repeat protein, partial [Bacillota bacterium]